MQTSVQKEEEKNNMFVAITRAKREYYLTYPLEKTMSWRERNSKVFLNTFIC
ncbi:hypothetical protein MO978_12350 [Lactococcus lactis]